MADTTYTAPDRLPEVAEGLLAGGVKTLQLRAKDLGSGDTLAAAEVLRRLTRRYGALFIINDRVDVAKLSGADGVHLGQSDLPVEGARRLLGPDSVIGLSTHSPEEAREAEHLGADYISFGPVYPTRTKGDAESPRGLKLLAETRRATRLPIVAIGGITEENAPGVLGAGADAVAMVSELLLSPDPAKKAASVIKALGG